MCECVDLGYRNLVAIRRAERANRVQTVRVGPVYQRRAHRQYRIVACCIAVRIDVHLKPVGSATPMTIRITK